jgi:2'-5' RNA ligase
MMTGEEAAESWRLFIAIAAPDFLKAEIIKVQEEMSASLPRGAVSWTKSEQFHLTLRFLGSVAKENIERIREQLQRSCENYCPLKLRAAGIGCFPNARAPRVIWVGIKEDKGQLLKLHDSIEKAVAEYTAEKADREFTGHLTLGRVKELGREGAEILRRELTRRKEQAFGAWKATAVDLMRSQLSPKGATHSVLHSIKMCGRYENS